MSFGRAFDAAVRNALLDVGDVLDIGSLPDDLQRRVSSGELTLAQAAEILLERSGASAPSQQGGSR